MRTIVVGQEHHVPYDRHRQAAVGLGITLASIALLLLCVGVSTPSWHIDYADALGVIPSWYTNFFYTCSVNGTCWNNQNILSSGVSYYAQPITGSPVSTDFYLRLRNAAGLSIVGLLFVAFGVIAALLLLVPSLHFIKFNGYFNLIAAFLLVIAALFQRAALSEGQRAVMLNGYSANLYQTGHALTIISIPICAFAAGRIYSSAPGNEPK